MDDMDQYERPEDLEFMIEKRNEQKELVSEAVVDDMEQIDSYMIIWVVLLITTAVLAVICAAQACKILCNDIKKKTRC